MYMKSQKFNKLLKLLTNKVKHLNKIYTDIMSSLPQRGFLLNSDS